MDVRPSPNTLAASLMDTASASMVLLPFRVAGECQRASGRASGHSRSRSAGKGRKLPSTGVFALVLQCLKQLSSAGPDGAVARFVAVRTHPFQHRLLDIRLQ